MKRPSSKVLFLAVGLLAASQSGNIIRLGHAPAVGIAAWRLALATLVLAPFAWRQRATLRSLGRRDAFLLVLVGLMLAAHFVSWIAAVQHTTVANAMLFFAINPLVTATAAALLFRERASPRLLASIGLGLAGVAVIGRGDLQLAPEHLVGDGLSLLSALFFSAYFLLGKHLHVTVVYGVAALPCAIALPLTGHTVFSWDAQTWLCFGLMAAVPTLIGHSALNHALEWMDAGRVATATLVEPLLGGLVAMWLWSEDLGVAAGIGYGFIAASVLVLLSDRRPRSR